MEAEVNILLISGDEFALNDDEDTDSNTDECVFALEPWLVFRWKFEVNFCGLVFLNIFGKLECSIFYQVGFHD